VICILTSLQAYVTTWIIPVYEKTGAAAVAEVYDLSTGFYYLLALAVVLGLVVSSVVLMGRKEQAM
jgi:lactate permease